MSQRYSTARSRHSRGNRGWLPTPSRDGASRRPQGTRAARVGALGLAHAASSVQAGCGDCALAIGVAEARGQRAGNPCAVGRRYVRPTVSGAKTGIFPDCDGDTEEGNSMGGVGRCGIGGSMGNENDGPVRAGGVARFDWAGSGDRFSGAALELGLSGTQTLEHLRGAIRSAGGVWRSPRGSPPLARGRDAERRAERTRDGWKAARQSRKRHSLPSIASTL